MTKLSNSTKGRALSIFLRIISFYKYLKQIVLLLRLSTFGNAGNAHYDYPKDSDMMELFQCIKTQTNRSAQRN